MVDIEIPPGKQSLLFFSGDRDRCAGGRLGSQVQRVAEWPRGKCRGAALIVSVWLIVEVGYRSAVCGLRSAVCMQAAGLRWGYGMDLGCWTLCLTLKWCSSTTPGSGRKGHGVGRAQEC